MKDLIKNLNWSKERVVYKQDKKLFLKTISNPTQEFWEIWKNNKEEIKAMGIFVNRHNGSWQVSWWKEEKQETTQKAIEESIKEISLQKQTEKILLPYQIEHTKKLIASIKKNNGALDASDTGTGKTYCALTVAKELNLFPIIITPKSVIFIWKKIAKIFDIDCYVNNYEQYRIGKTPYLSINNEQKNSFLWNIPKNAILIFDEVHRTKNKRTQNAKMMVKACHQDLKILGLSATIADNPLQMYAIGSILKLFNSQSGYWSWARARGVYKGSWGMVFENTSKNLQRIHKDIFPSRGSRISIKNLGDLFPDNQIITECYMNNSSKKIQSVYDKMYTELEKLKKTKKEDRDENPLTVILRARQEIELLKVPTFVELVEDHIEAENSIAIFVNFEDTVQALSKRLKTNCIITGKISEEERNRNIEKFQNDEERIIICNIKAGGVGISLHDLNGKYSRISLISPTYSAQDLLQSLGRIHRAGAKSKAIQKIIFCSETIEENICMKVEQKINNIHLINDGDLS